MRTFLCRINDRSVFGHLPRRSGSLLAKRLSRLFFKLQLSFWATLAFGVCALSSKKPGKETLANSLFLFSLLSAGSFSYFLVVFVITFKERCAIPLDERKLPSADCFNHPAGQEIDILLKDLNDNHFKQLLPFFAADVDLSLLKVVNQNQKLSSDTLARLNFHSAALRAFFNKGKRSEVGSDLERLEILTILEKILKISDLNLGVFVSEGELRFLNLTLAQAVSIELAPEALMQFLRVCETIIRSYIEINQYIKNKREEAEFANLTNAIRAELSAHVRVDLPPPLPYTGSSIPLDVVMGQLKILLSIATRNIPDLSLKSLKLAYRLNVLLGQVGDENTQQKIKQILTLATKLKPHDIAKDLAEAQATVATDNRVVSISVLTLDNIYKIAAVTALRFPYAKIINLHCQDKNCSLDLPELYDFVLQYGLKPKKFPLWVDNFVLEDLLNEQISLGLLPLPITKTFT